MKTIRWRQRRLPSRCPEGVIYLDGNSLGVLPAHVPDRMQQVIRSEWGESLIRGWNDHDWIDLPQRVGDRIARLIGAAPGTVVAADSTSINVFKVLAAALALRPERKVILSDNGNFPTDLYVASGLKNLLDKGHELKNRRAGGGRGCHRRGSRRPDADGSGLQDRPAGTT